MKAVKITIILLIAAGVWGFITNDSFFHIAKALPFCHGKDINPLYEVAGLVIVGLFFWGLYRLNRNKDRRDEEN